LCVWGTNAKFCAALICHGRCGAQQQQGVISFRVFLFVLVHNFYPAWLITLIPFELIFFYLVCYFSGSAAAVSPKKV
jgi:hypothetical protein